MKVYTIKTIETGKLENYGNLKKLISEYHLLIYHRVYHRLRSKGYYSDDMFVVYLRELKRGNSVFN